MYRIQIICLFVLLINCNYNSNIQPVDKSVVENVDINKFVGKWYEIARFPHSFEKNLVGVTATYSFRKDGKIRVLNQGYKRTLDGKLKKAIGKAKIPNPNETGKLKVSFFMFFYADYYILDLDEENYQFAIIGSSSDNYLWILSRTPGLTTGIYNMLLIKAKDRGYDISKLMLVPQKSE